MTFARNLGAFADNVNSSGVFNPLPGTATIAPMILQAGTNLSTATAGAVEYDGKVVYATPQGTQRGLISSEQYYRLNSTLTGTNATGGQAVLGVGVTLSSSTVYQFEAVFALNKTAGTTSYTMSTLFGGTATLNNIGYLLTRYYDTVSFAGANNAPAAMAYVQVATAFTSMTASTAATSYHILVMRGTVSVNAGGTFIPQYSLSAAPGGAFTTAIGSYFSIYPIGAAGANTSVGTWA